jgi:cyclopropane fatty-acyl-phospholipid synthase-like methyltransferase
VKNNTLKYYNNNADELSSRYNSVDFGSIQKSVSSYLTGAKRILEIGCGSGRDAIYMVNNGFDIIGIDGSEQMLLNAEANYPKLKGKLIKAILPNEFPNFKDKFEGVYSIATLMHFDVNGIGKILNKIKSVLLPNSPVFISVSGKRDIQDERYFIDFSKDDWLNIFEGNGFAINGIIETQDATNREIIWYSFLMETI